MKETSAEALLLGIAQDAGYPSPGCRRSCCGNAWRTGAPVHYPASLAVLDGLGRRWLLDCTPQFPQQLAMLDRLRPPGNGQRMLEAIFLTHAHIGHYTGLMYLGREALGSNAMPVYVMPRMAAFLRGNGPWSQLLQIGNIELHEITAGEPIRLADGLWIEAIEVPHRAEFSETVAYRVTGPRSSLIYMPDTDRWEGINPAIEELVLGTDHLLLDATFHSGDELPGRDMREIPHPTAMDSMARFASLSPELRNRISFFHFNHTNPLLDPHSQASQQLREQAYHVVEEGSAFPL